MTFIVEMAHGTSDQPVHATFSCSAHAWQQLLALGQAFGWKPQGTVPDKDYRGPEPFKPDYEPNDWLGAKLVAAEDAFNWADALSRAVQVGPKAERLDMTGPVFLGDDMPVEDIRRVNSSVAGILPTFVEFLRKGEFAFAWDD